MYRIFLPRHFVHQLKQFLKKYRRLETDIQRTLEGFTPGSAQYLGAKIYKVRLKSSDVARGKNVSFRLIVYLLEVNELLVPITLYFKGAARDISEKEIEYHLSMVLSEL